MRQIRDEAIEAATADEDECVCIIKQPESVRLFTTAGGGG